MKRYAPLTFLLLLLLTTANAWGQIAQACIELNPAVVQQGDTANATGRALLSIGSNVCKNGGTPVITGSLTLQEAKDGFGQQTSCGSQVGFITGSTIPVDLNGTAVFPLDTSKLGIFGYRVLYTPDPPRYTSVSPCLDQTVIQQTCSGVTLATDIALGDGNPPAGVPEEWVIEVKLHACQDAVIQKVQGGNNGWALLNNVSVSQGSFTINQKNKNETLTWTMPPLSVGTDATMLITLDGTIKKGTPSGTVVGLLGAWSVTYSTDGGKTYQKSDYTGVITVTVK